MRLMLPCKPDRFFSASIFTELPLQPVWGTVVLCRFASKNYIVTIMKSPWDRYTSTRGEVYVLPRALSKCFNYSPYPVHEPNSRPDLDGGLLFHLRKPLCETLIGFLLVEALLNIRLHLIEGLDPARYSLFKLDDMKT